MNNKNHNKLYRPIMRTREVVNNNDDSNNTDLKDGQNDKLEKNRNFD